MIAVPEIWSPSASLSPRVQRLRDEYVPFYERDQKFKALLRAYGRIGGTALQVNMLDADTLRRAQRDPDTYGNLLVRVTGYNAYFVGLGKEIQDEIIARESHRL